MYCKSMSTIQGKWNKLSQKHIIQRALLLFVCFLFFFVLFFYTFRFVGVGNITYKTEKKAPHESNSSLPQPAKAMPMNFSIPNGLKYFKEKLQFHCTSFHHITSQSSHGCSVLTITLSSCWKKPPSPRESRPQVEYVIIRRHLFVN